MTIAFVGNITVPSGITDACTRTSIPEIVICEQSGSTVRRFDLGTLTQNGSNISTISAPTSIALISATKALVGTQSSQTCAVIDLVAETSSTISSMDYTYAAKPQQIAGDITAEIAFMTGNTVGKLVKVSTTGPTGTLLTPSYLSNTNASAVIFKADTSTFFVGTTNGQIFEIDSNGACLSSFQLGEELRTLSVDIATGSGLYVQSMSYAYGTLFVNTPAGYTAVISWDAKKLLRLEQAAPGGTLFSNFYEVCMISTPVAGGSGKKTTNHVDAFYTPSRTVGHIWHAGSGIVAASGIHINTAWVAFTGTTNLPVMTLSGQRTISVQTIDLDDAGAVPGEVVFIEDAGATGDAVVEFAQYIPAGGMDVPLTDASEFIQLAKIGTGVNEKVDVRRTTT